MKKVLLCVSAKGLDLLKHYDSASRFRGVSFGFLAYHSNSVLSSDYASYMPRDHTDAVNP